MSLKNKGNKAPSQNKIVDLVNNFDNKLKAVKRDQSSIAQQPKRNTIKKNLKELASLADQIAPLLGTAPPDVANRYTQLGSEYEAIKNELSRQIEALDLQEQKEQQQQNAAPEQGGNGQLNQSLIDNDTQQIEILGNAANEIVDEMRNLNEMQHLLNDKIQEQHEVVINVDDRIEEGNEEMVKGNENLNTAQEHQKSSTKCLIWILVAVIIIIAVILLIIFLPRK